MKQNKRNIVIAIMLAMFLAAFEGTVVTTAMPTISKSLNGFNLISWVFSSYLLTSAVSTPVYGKLSDLYGRRKIIVTGIIIFIIGSFLCALSTSMVHLILFRTIQGIGAGSILTISFTIVGDIFEIEERAKIQGTLNTVWGIAGLIGPFIGGFILDYLSWHWIFLINVPFGIISIVLLMNNFDEELIKKKSIIDYQGIVILTLAIVSLLFGTMQIENGVTKMIPYILVTMVLLFTFYLFEKKSTEPLIPFNIFNRTTIIINIIGFVASVVIVIIDSYMPIYIQNVLGYNATISGLSLAPMSISWLLSTFTLGKLLTKVGEKRILQVCSVIMLISSSLLITLKSISSLPVVIIIVITMGYGAGALFTIVTIVAQIGAEESMRGVATSTNSLIRTLGQTIGVSIFGSILNNGIEIYFKEQYIEGINSNNIFTAIDNNIIKAVDGSNAMFNGMHFIFIAMTFVAAINLITTFLLPKKSIIKD